LRLKSIEDQSLINGIIGAWAVARDSGDWPTLRSCWHSNGRMKTTFYEGPATEFVDAVGQQFDRGAVVHHLMGGTHVEIEGARAIAQSKTVISQRLVLHDVEVDITCTGRFYDFFELRDAWRLVLREPVYEKDRIDPVDSNTSVDLDSTLLSRFPPGCRHLMYSQAQSGLAVRTNVAQLRGAEVEGLYAAGRRWLHGDSLDR
jgi:hypothetical protein